MHRRDRRLERHRSETEAGSGNPSFNFKQEGEKLTGKYKGLLGEFAPDRNGQRRQDRILVQSHRPG